MKNTTESVPCLNHVHYLSVCYLLVLLANCVARPGTENGQPPTFNFSVKKSGRPVININSSQACPPEGLGGTNNFDTVFLSLAANRTYQFIYGVSDMGGVSIADFITFDTTEINFDVQEPDEAVISTYPGRDRQKQVRLTGSSEPKKLLLMTGNLYTQDVRTRTNLTFQGFDLANNSVFHTLTVIIAPNFESEVIFEGDCR